MQSSVCREGQCTEGTAVVLKANGELGVKEGEVRLFLGRTVKTAFLPCWQCRQNGLFYLTDCWLCSQTDKSVDWSGSFSICWRKFSVTRSDDLFLWPICWNMKIALLFGTFIFSFHYPITSITHNNGKAGYLLIGDAVARIPALDGGGQPLRSLSILIVCNFSFTDSLNHYTRMQCDPAFKNLQKKMIIRMPWESK